MSPAKSLLWVHKAKTWQNIQKKENKDRKKDEQKFTFWHILPLGSETEDPTLYVTEENFLFVFWKNIDLAFVRVNFDRPMPND